MRRQSVVDIMTRTKVEKMQMEARLAPLRFMRYAMEETLRKRRYVPSTTSTTARKSTSRALMGFVVRMARK